uniref:P12 n=1 Tax=Rice tungro bacilliform virus TaxID=10654 RepID=A0A481ZJP0_9VIRU|nr:P12 [Rice tungro bacilliform virus]
MSADYPTFKEALEKFKNLESETAAKDKFNWVFTLENIKTTADVNLASKGLVQLYALQEIDKKINNLTTQVSKLPTTSGSSSAGAIVPAGSNTQGQYKAPPKKGIKRKYPA